MMRRVTLSLFFLTSTDATRRETSALLSLSNDEENNGPPQDRLASGFECSRDISDSSNLRPRNFKSSRERFDSSSFRTRDAFCLIRGGAIDVSDSNSYNS